MKKEKSSAAPCPRCEGSGRVVGTGPHERAWSSVQGIALHQVLKKVLGIERPRACPACGGTGRAKH